MEELTNMFAKLPELLVEFGSLGTAGWIAGGVLVLLLGVGGFFLWRWLKKRRVEKSNRATEENRNQNDTSLPGKQARLERGARESVRRLRERLKKNI